MRAINVNKAMRCAPGTIKKSASLILRKLDDESKYVGTFAMASFNKKTYARWLHSIRKVCNHCQKRGVIFLFFFLKMRNCFCKYAIVDNQVA